MRKSIDGLAVLLLSSQSGGVYEEAIKTYKDAAVSYIGTKNMGIITAAGSQNK